MEKIIDRQITREDINELIDTMNNVLLKVETLNNETDSRLKSLTTETEKARTMLTEINASHKVFQGKLDGYYSKQIELIGIFIAIFSFIITNIYNTLISITNTRTIIRILIISL